MPQRQQKLNGFWVLAVMLLLLHFAISKGFNSPLSRSLMLAHLGLFFIWQPIWRREQRLALKSGLLFVLFTGGFIYALNGWILSAWILLLIGLIAGQVLDSRLEIRTYLVALIFLFSEFLLHCIPELFHISNLTKTQYSFAFGLSLLPFLIILMTWGHTPESQLRPMDIFRGITVSLIAAILAAGSLLNMYYSAVIYPVALLHSLIALSIFLFALSWLSSPVFGFSGLAQLWERSLMNIGTPFELWLSELAELAEKEKMPSTFVKAAMQKLVNLAWVSGVYWQLNNEQQMTGKQTKHCLDLHNGTLSTKLYSHRPIGPTLRIHCQLLLQLVEQFHLAKVREIELIQQTHLQAIYATGARVTHDIKNLLQSLQVITSLIESDPSFDQEQASPAQQLLKRQLPHIRQRMQLALDKLCDPEDISTEQMLLKTWWQKLQERSQNQDISFQAEIEENPIIPSDLFDSVIENLLENINYKSQHEPSIEITISLLAHKNQVELCICDTGKAINDTIVKQLFKQALDSQSGLGIGLYQAARQAQLNGFKLALIDNQDGRVCFLLSKQNSDALDRSIHHIQ